MDVTFYKIWSVRCLQHLTIWQGLVTVELYMILDSSRWRRTYIDVLYILLLRHGGRWARGLEVPEAYATLSRRPFLQASSN